MPRCATVALWLCLTGSGFAQIVISPASLPDGVVNTPYSQTLSGSGCVGSCMWSASGSLPTGLSLDPNTGQIGGTPTTAGSFQFTALVTDGNLDSGSQPYTIAIHTAPVITTTTLPSGMVGQVYSQSIGAANGTPPYSFSISAGALPAGLSLAPSTGGISGAPTVAGSSTFSVTVTDSMNATASQAYTISIAPAIPPLRITTSSLPAGVVGTPYNQTLAATGGTPPYTWDMAGGALPAGISLAPSGQLSGTPSKPGSSGFTVQVTDNRGTRALASLGIPVAPPPLNFVSAPPPSGTVGTPYSTTFTGTGGIPPYSWDITGGTLPPGLSLNGSTGTLAGSPTQRGIFSFTVRLSDSGGDTPVTAQFGITMDPPKLVITSPAPLPSGVVGQPYGVPLSATGGVPPYTWSLTTGSLPAGLQLNGSTGEIGGNPISPGTSSFTAQVSDSTNVHTSLQFSIAIAPPKLVITTSSLPPGTQGTPYSQALSAAGGVPPYVWTLNSGTLPAGLVLNAVAGAISGVPGATGTFNLNIGVNDSAGTPASVSLTLVISGPKLVIITTSPLPAATLNSAYTQTLAAAGGSPPYQWSIQSGSLPPGLTLNANGAISGTPTTQGTSAFTAQVSDAGNTVTSAQFSLNVAAPTLSISSASSLPVATLGVAYSLNLTATGGVPPYKWSITTGSLPSGLSLAGASGAISGTATIVGSFTFNLRVTDNAGATADSLESILVSAEPPPPPTVALSQMPATANSAAQIPIDLALSNSYSQPVSGQITLTFQPDSAAPKDDPAIQFSNGSRTARFTVPAGSTHAAFAGSALALQTGSVAGTIHLSVLTDLPNTNLSSSITVARTAPVISSAAVVRSSSGFQVRISGFSNSRDLAGAQFHFTAVSGQTLQTGDLSVDLRTAATQWFAADSSAAFGGQFLVVVPFTVDAGSVGSLSSVRVQMQNTQGTSAPSAANF